MSDTRRGLLGTNRELLLMFLIPGVLPLVFFYLPMVGTIIGFKDFRMNEGVFGSAWKGLTNFARLFTGRDFLRALRNTLVISVLRLGLGFFAPVVLALMLNEVRLAWYKRMVQTVTYLPLSLRLVTELHDRLMQGVRGEQATPGEFRRSQNWIGVPGCTLQNATYIPPPVDELMQCMGEWEIFLNDRSLPPLVQTAMMHSQFEAIHPFLDGNGRVGRLLITLFLVERDILPIPLLYLSAFFEATRRDYYDGLKGVTERAAWQDWIKYFLNGVARMSEDSLSRAERINALFETWRARATGRSKVPLLVLGLLEENPYCTVTKVAEELGVTFTTAQRGIGRLVSLGILKLEGDSRRNRVFCAHQVMDILDEPAAFRP